MQRASLESASALWSPMDLEVELSTWQEATQRFVMMTKERRNPGRTEFSVPRLGKGLLVMAVTLEECGVST